MGGMFTIKFYRFSDSKENGLTDKQTYLQMKIIKKKKTETDVKH